MNLLESAREFFAMLWRVLPRALWIEALAWLVTFAFLVVTFKTLKTQLKPGLIKIDENVRAWAKTLRYHASHPDKTRAQAQRAGQLELAAARTDDIPETISPMLDDKLDNDDEVREIALELDDDTSRERVPLTWFFRFWTNFASAPSLCFFSLAVPLAATHFAAKNAVDLQFFTPQARTQWLLGQAAIWLVPGLCYAGSMLMSYVLKRIFKRLRPQRKVGAFGHKLKDGSFPSGHSLTSFCFWMAMIWTVFAVQIALPWAIIFGVAAVSVVALTGLSRVYLGVHFPTDVLGGYTIGAAWCVACAWALPLALNWERA